MWPAQFNRPGVYRLPAGARVEKAIELGGRADGKG